MKIILFGASGGLGQWTWKAAVARGHDVVAFVRSPEKLDRDDPGHARLTIAVGNALDGAAVQEASRGCEIAINCTSPASGDATLDLARSIAGNASAAGVERFTMVGGLGALWVPGSDRSLLVQDWEDEAAMARHGLPPMPKERIRAMTQGHLAAMDYMATTGLASTFVCPGMMVPGPATAERVVTLDEVGGRQAMRVNLGDVAEVIVDDLDRGELVGHRVCVAAS